MARTDSSTVIVGSFVTCPRPKEINIYNDYVIKLDEYGFISAFVPRKSDKGRIILDGLSSHTICKYLPSHSFMLPTFCDLHLHAPQMLYLGTGLHLPLLEWLEKYAYKAEERIDGDLGLASQVYKRLVRRLIENGTGAALVFGTIRTETNLLLAKAFQEAGVRAHVGKLSMDLSTRPSYVEPSAAEAIDDPRKFIYECRALTSHLPAHERLVHPVVTPRFVPACTRNLLSQLGDLASETSTMVQSHLAEAKDQLEWVKQNHGIDDIDIFAQSGLLTPRTVQAHCTFLSPPSLTRLRSLGTAIAHCPLSNAYFSARPFPLREAMESGVKLGLGTDIAGGYQTDIMASMRMAVIVSRMREGGRLEKEIPGDPLDITWKEALYLATTGGATALGLEVGENPFQEGCPFDAQQIDLYDEHSGGGIGNIDFFDPPPSSASEDMVEKWWCLGDNRNRSAVYVQGKHIL